MEASVRWNLSGTFTRLVHLQQEQKEKKARSVFVFISRPWVCIKMLMSSIQQHL